MGTAEKSKVPCAISPHPHASRQDYSNLAYRSELEITYDKGSFPIGGKCRICGEQLPTNETESLNAADTILWLADQFSINKSEKHSEGTLGYVG